MSRMSSPEAHFVHALWITFVGTGLLALFLSLLGKVGATRLIDTLSYAPALDLVVGAFTIVPWIAAITLGGFAGFLGALIGQFATLACWCAGHELAHAQQARGPKIVEFHSRTIGDWKNYAALSITLIAVPIFWSIRLFQITCGWTMPLLVGFPKYRDRDWINVSRHKFDGLIGHDLVWCLYCDWMTGVWSLGSEVLRNVESFWCPIRYYDGKKCDNCAVDFPDINNGWVPIDGKMPDVIAKMEQMYGDGRREWFGHPARLTVKGKPIESAAAPAPSSSTT
jgi:hypothetical protein